MRDKQAAGTCDRLGLFLLLQLDLIPSHVSAALLSTMARGRRSERKGGRW